MNVIEPVLWIARQLNLGGVSSPDDEQDHSGQRAAGPEGKPQTVEGEPPRPQHR